MVRSHTSRARGSEDVLKQCLPALPVCQMVAVAGMMSDTAPPDIPICLPSGGRRTDRNCFPLKEMYSGLRSREFVVLLGKW